MSLSQETLIEIMSLADGELEGEARARVEQLVAGSEEARRALDGFRAPHVPLWLPESLDRHATSAGADRIADAVMGAIDAGEQDAPVSAKVVRIAPRPAASRASRGGLLAVSTVGVVGAMALAAGIALFIRSTARPESDQMPVASVGMPSVDMQRPPAEPSAGGQGVEVDDVDSPSRGISVFEIPLAPLAGAAASVGARSGSSVVVWIDDEGPK